MTRASPPPYVLSRRYTDGTVLVAHGGTEMGQGLNTKMAQVAADAFGIEVDRVHVADCSSDKVPNNPPTGTCRLLLCTTLAYVQCGLTTVCGLGAPVAASYGSDLNGMAVLNACERIMARLAPLRDLHLGKLDDFAALAEAAYYERVSLMAEGFYAPPRGAEYDWDPTIVDNADRGDVWNYFAVRTPRPYPVVFVFVGRGLPHKDRDASAHAGLCAQQPASRFAWV
jgi:xanthine dehydrogenase molybdopterin-binding subunit B